MRFTSEAFYREAFRLPGYDVLREALDRGKVVMVGDGFVACAAYMLDFCCSAMFLTDEIEVDGERLSVGRVYYNDEVAAYCTTYEMWDRDGQQIVVLAGQLVPSVTPSLLLPGRALTWVIDRQNLNDTTLMCMVGAEFVHTPGFPTERTNQ